MDVIDPSTGSVLTRVADGSAADIDAAVQAARDAFDDGEWSQLPGRERARVLTRVAELMRERSDELAAAESLDVGKPISLARAIDVNNTADTFEYYGSLAHHLDGATRDIPAPAFAYTRTEPRGVVGAITPFNFPIILTSSKLAPALAAGNVDRPQASAADAAQRPADGRDPAGRRSSGRGVQRRHGATPRSSAMRSSGTRVST